MAIIGIDLGTTNSLAAVWKDGKSVLIPNALGEVLTPSAVSIGEDGAVLVGRAAQERLITHPEASATSFKRSMGRDAVYTLAGRRFAPEELSSLVLRKLKEDAEAFLGEAVDEAVVSVPAYFSDSQRAATKRAGLLAGLRVERLVNEPSAAALACRGAAGDDACFLVFDFGGGTLDVSVVECFDNVVNILAVCGDNQLGGDDFDAAIARLFCEQNGIGFDSLSPAHRAMLLAQAERCKRALTDAGLAVMVAEAPGIAGTLTLNGQTLIEKSDQLFARMRAPLRRALADSGLSPDEVAAVIPVGGSCRMPVVRQYLTHLLGKKLVQPGAPDTVVALGAGLYAGMKARCGGLREMVLTDICPFTLGINNHNAAQPDRPFLAPIIERNSALPCSKTKRFYTVADGQTSIVAKIYQGEALYADDNLYLGELQTGVPPAPAGQQAVDVRFAYDINGILEAEVTGCATRETKRAVLVGAKSGLTDAEAQARLAQLQKLKIHPRRQEENALLLARARRIHEESLGGLRQAVAGAVEQFERILEGQEQARIARARRSFAAFLDRAEQGMEADGFFFDPNAES